MSLPTATDLFESGLAPPATAHLEALIRQHLELATRDVDMTSDTPPSSPPETPSSSSNPGALLNEVGEYLTRTAMVWSSLTEKLMKGPHIDRVTLEVHENSRTESRLSDFTAIVAMDMDIGRLRKIRDLTAQFSRDVQSVWRPDSSSTDMSPDLPSGYSPYCDMSTTSQSMTAASDGEHRAFKARKLLPDNAHTVIEEEISESDDSDDDDEEQFARIDMEALRQRGKGAYYCPKGHRCDKGGVDKDGNLVLFDRNSSFAQHCNKHRKPWRCDVPGCPNPPKKRRFARRDGLERHKATVKHYLVT